MSGRLWLLSVLVLFHVVAVTVDAIPSPDELRSVQTEIRHPAGDVVSHLLTPLFDAVAIHVASVEPIVYRAVQPLRVVTRPYINAGLRQSWKMFTVPELYDHYMRLDYYVTSPGSPQPRRIQELVLPAGREDRVRILHDFRDKAVLNSMSALLEPQSSPTSAGDAPDGLVPLVRYFTNRYREQSFTDGDTIVKTEVWWGAAPIPPPGESIPEAILQSRLDALTHYYGGPVASVLGASSPHELAAEEREADLTWKLQFVDRP
jgi:hypothetical protein